MVIDKRIRVIGLGYVGLPLARLFSTKYPNIEYDVNKDRVADLMSGNDITREGILPRESVDGGL